MVLSITGHAQLTARRVTEEQQAASIQSVTMAPSIPSSSAHAHLARLTLTTLELPRLARPALRGPFRLLVLALPLVFAKPAPTKFLLVLLYVKLVILSLDAVLLVALAQVLVSVVHVFPAGLAVAAVFAPCVLRIRIVSTHCAPPVPVATLFLHLLPPVPPALAAHVIRVMDLTLAFLPSAQDAILEIMS